MALDLELWRISNHESRYILQSTESESKIIIFQAIPAYLCEKQTGAPGIALTQLPIVVLFNFVFGNIALRLLPAFLLCFILIKSWPATIGLSIHLICAPSSSRGGHPIFSTHTRRLRPHPTSGPALATLFFNQQLLQSLLKRLLAKTPLITCADFIRKVSSMQFGSALGKLLDLLLQSSYDGPESSVR